MAKRLRALFCDHLNLMRGKYVPVIESDTRFCQSVFGVHYDKDLLPSPGAKMMEGLPQPFKDFILMGHSAGAHSAALLAADSRYLRNRGIKARLAGLIGIAGPYDLPMDDPEVRPVFMTSTSDRTKVVSNVTQGMPPTLLLHGFADTRVKPFHTERFRDALIKNGNSVTTRLYSGVNHTKIIGSLAAPLRFLNNSFKDVKAFLARYN